MSAAGKRFDYLAWPLPLGARNLFSTGYSCRGRQWFSLPVFCWSSRSGHGKRNTGRLLLSFARTGRPLLPADQIMALLPSLLLLTAAFVAGFTFF